jgi:5-methylcytosine-specific restriction enzyme A
VSRVKTLGSRVSLVSSRKLAVVSSESWRDGKTTAERGYGGKWQRERLVFLQKNPLCVFCIALGVIEAATVVDHKIPHLGDQKLFWDRKNWQGLCTPCHSSVKQKLESQNKIG